MTPEPLIRVRIAEIEERAKERLPGYLEAFMATGEIQGDRIAIRESRMKELWAQYSAPGLGDELNRGCGSCG